MDKKSKSYHRNQSICDTCLTIHTNIVLPDNNPEGSLHLAKKGHLTFYISSSQGVHQSALTDIQEIQMRELYLTKQA